MHAEGMLDRKRIETLFEALDAELDRLNASAELYVAGGARMALGLREGRTTSDVDVSFRRTEGAVDQALETVGEQNGLKPSWLNSAMLKTLPSTPDSDESTLYEGRRLKIIGASPKRVLAMKVMALRTKDLDDIRALMKSTGIETVEQIGTLIKEHYASEGPGAEALAQVRLPILAKWLEREARAQRKPTQPGGDPKIGALARGKSAAEAMTEGKHRLNGADKTKPKR